MHVAAANPLALDSTGVDPAVVAREKNVLPRRTPASRPTCWKRSSNRASRPISRKSALVDQAFIHDPSKTVRRS
jgi:elongation factor Ts